MKIISFSWTSKALLKGRKTVTRRDWDDKYASRFHKGDLIKAYDRNPRMMGMQIATIEITIEPYKEWSNKIDDNEWYREGFDYLTEIRAKMDGLAPIDIWNDWIMNPRELWVIRFKLVEVKNAKSK